MNSLYSRFDILAMISFIASRYVSAEVFFFAAMAFSSCVVKFFMIFPFCMVCLPVGMAWGLEGVKR